jgi:class 3 adenylate cyclase
MSTYHHRQAEKVVMRNLPTGTVTLLFTDIEGSTRLLTRLGERYAGVLAEYRHLLRGVFEHWHGHEVDTQGDAFFTWRRSPSTNLSRSLFGERKVPGLTFK